MTQIPLVCAEQPPHFPPTCEAMQQPNGLLAAGGDLTVEWLLEAYQHGIFPWFSEDEPILWWSPTPRMVLKPNQAYVNRSLKKAYRRGQFHLKANTCFEQVIEQCAAPRDEHGGTWIIEEMVEAYIDLHHAGYAHSIEVFNENELIGGLYGVAFGSMFFGESMFSLKSNASKYAFVGLSEAATTLGVTLIDCQMHNDYLASMGAALMESATFNTYLPKERRRLTTLNNQTLSEALHNRMTRS